MSPAKRNDNSEMSTIRLTKDLKERLQKRAKQDIRTFADEVRFILEDWLKKNPE